MQILITARQDIKSSKTGKEYTVYHGMYENGETAQVIVGKDQADDYNIPVGAVTSKAQLKEMFATYPVCDIEFNQRGRVQKIDAGKDE